MGRLWNKWLVPALFAVILFLCIRVANDIPKHEYYWESNEWNFMRSIRTIRRNRRRISISRGS